MQTENARCCEIILTNLKQFEKNNDVIYAYYYP